METTKVDQDFFNAHLDKSNEPMIFTVRVEFIPSDEFIQDVKTIITRATGKKIGVTTLDIANNKEADLETLGLIFQSMANINDYLFIYMPKSSTILFHNGVLEHYTNNPFEDGIVTLISGSPSDELNEWMRAIDKEPYDSFLKLGDALKSIPTNTVDTGDSE